MQDLASPALDHLLAVARALSIELAADASGVGIGLREPALSFHHSFLIGALARRAHQSSQALLKACNNKARSIERVLDLTAGWGADSLTLAHHNRQVTLLEQNALIAAVLAYSRERLAQDPAGAGVARRMRVENTEAGAYLQAPATAVDLECIYLDPMFPSHKSSAKPAKEMQILQRLTDNHGIELVFELALAKAQKRVVVKRPAKAGNLAGIKPDIVYREKTIRFDVYLTA